jgi:3-methyladenine DNA glycosylase AlkD
MPYNLKQARAEIKRGADPARAKIMQNFFKTGPGEYAEGDVFLGLTVPQTRSVAKECRGLSLDDLAVLLESKFHEERLLALIVLTQQFERADEAGQKAIYEFYLDHRARINNWDLVDVSAPRIVGGYLLTRPRTMLHKLAKSKSLWDRRIAIVATWWLIRARDFDDCLQLCETLIHDKHDLIHKATGWMLREVGKKDVATLKRFLAIYKDKLPRTALRYAIEKFSLDERKMYLSKI